MVADGSELVDTGHGSWNNILVIAIKPLLSIPREMDREMSPNGLYRATSRRQTTSKHPTLNKLVLCRGPDQ